jgi:hypothetical protein
MNRRHFLTASTLLAGSGAHAQAPGGQPSFEQLLSAYEADPQQLEDAWGYRDSSVSRGVGVGTPSKREISPKAKDMIVRLEVGSQARYERLYQGPIWPKGLSGVTIGIGYDLRFASKSILRRDWGKLLDSETLAMLDGVTRLSGDVAQASLASVAKVRVPWAAAMTQFSAFLPYVTADTEGVFPNCEHLSDDSLGALVSLVYNRGASVPRNKPERAEMVKIRDLMAVQAFEEIPTQIRAMKRLWTTDDSRGLVIRRELEAQLFKSGLA